MLTIALLAHAAHWGGVTENKENPDLAMFTTKVLLDEIKARGYSGTLEYKKTIRI